MSIGKINIHSPALLFVGLLGVANLFGDITYEGGASLNGQFLGSLGATAMAISIIAGLGEFLGYSLRSVSGYVADKKGNPWLITILGYGLNLFSVPAMALVSNWQSAAVLICTERIGRAIRKPTVEAMLSYTTKKYGRGWIYAVNTALDETGATVGPLLVAYALTKGASFKLCYSLFVISSVFTLFFVFMARLNFPSVEKLEQEESDSNTHSHFRRSYWIYMSAGAFFAAGLMSYELLSFHIQKNFEISADKIPILLAFATGSGVISNLALGKLYDKFGMKVVLSAVLLTALFGPLAFWGSFPLLICSMILLGLGYATQDTLLKAIVAGHLPPGRRNFAFGLFYTGYGIGWLVGSATTGVLYERSHLALVGFLVAVQLISFFLFALASRLDQPEKTKVPST